VKNATMMYKMPGPYNIHGGHFDYIILDADEKGAIQQAQADGWCLTTPEAKKAYEATKILETKPSFDNSSSSTTSPSVIRAELEQKCNEFKIKFNAKTTNDELIKLIQAKIRG